MGVGSPFIRLGDLLLSCQDHHLLIFLMSEQGRLAYYGWSVRLDLTVVSWSESC